MAEKSVPIFEGRPDPKPANGEKWIRLVVRRSPRDDDKEAETLLRAFAKALESSDYRDEFILSIFRVESEKEASFGKLPKIENKSGCEGILEVRRFLSTYADDVKVPLVS